jgi:hypothetical protein
LLVFFFLPFLPAGTGDPFPSASWEPGGFIPELAGKPVCRRA